MTAAMAKIALDNYDFEAMSPFTPPKLQSAQTAASAQTADVPHPSSARADQSGPYLSRDVVASSVSSTYLPQMMVVRGDTRQTMERSTGENESDVDDSENSHRKTPDLLKREAEALLHRLGQVIANTATAATTKAAATSAPSPLFTAAASKSGVLFRSSAVVVNSEYLPGNKNRLSGDDDYRTDHSDHGDQSDHDDHSDHDDQNDNNDNNDNNEFEQYFFDPGSIAQKENKLNKALGLGRDNIQPDSLLLI